MIENTKKKKGRGGGSRQNIMSKTKRWYPEETKKQKRKIRIERMKRGKKENANQGGIREGKGRGVGERQRNTRGVEEGGEKGGRNLQEEKIKREKGR